MKDYKRLKFRYFVLSFSLSFLVLSFTFWVLINLVHPKTPLSLIEQAQAAEEGPAYVPVQEDCMTVLFIGSDGDGAGSFLIARFDPVTGKVPILTLPSNTLLRSADKEQMLHEAYKYGGADYTRKLIAQTLNITIDRYVRMNSQSLIECATVIGSVEYELPRKIEINTGASSIVMQKGLQLLDGRKVAALMRYADYENGEEERCAHASELAAQIVNQRMDVALSTVADNIFSKVVNLIDTDISFPDYEKRKEAAIFMAKLAENPGYVVEAQGALDPEKEQYVLSDTFIASLTRIFE